MSRSGLIGAIVTASIALSAGQPLAQVCGTTITTTTTLASDLRNCTGTGVIIGKPNITLDLGGHTIDGDGNNLGNGVDNKGYKGVTIKNGRIQEFMSGVSLENATQNRLRELVVSHNHDGIFLSKSDNNRIERNTTSDNENIGISLTGDAAAGDGSDNNLVDQNSSYDNGNFGIAVENSSDGNRIRKNQANDNGFPNNMSGIFIDGASAGTTIEDNVANLNKTDGIFVSNVVMTTVKNNTANKNGDQGINVVASGTDGGGNKAKGNGNVAAQCNNVICP